MMKSAIYFIVCKALFLGVTAVYDPNQPHQTENFDPAEADPSGNITCLGDSYAINLPVIAGFNPNLVTMQQLCAKPQYNGGRPGQHVGGWCAPTISSRGPRRRVAFDQSPAALTSTELSNLRVLLGCLLKCFCNSATADLKLQPVNDDEALHDHYWQSTSTYEIKADVVDDFDVPRVQHMGSLPGQWVNSVSILGLIQVNGPSSYDVTSVSMDQENRILCRGPLPSFELPAPFQHSYNNVQELCAVQFFGGNLYVLSSFLTSSVSRIKVLNMILLTVLQTPGATVTAQPSVQAKQLVQSGSPTKSRSDTTGPGITFSPQPPYDSTAGSIAPAPLARLERIRLQRHLQPNYGHS